MNSTIINETTLSIGNRVYRYVIVSIYYSESKLNFMPQEIRVDDVFIKYLPRNKSVTYTGIIPYSYLMRYRGKTYDIGFGSITYVEASYYLTTNTDRVSDDIYEVTITVARELDNTAYIDVAWLILYKE